MEGRRGDVCTGLRVMVASDLESIPLMNHSSGLSPRNANTGPSGKTGCDGSHGGGK
jgi:hypothetical protein